MPPMPALVYLLADRQAQACVRPDARRMDTEQDMARFERPPRQASASRAGSELLSVLRHAT